MEGWGKAEAGKQPALSLSFDILRKISAGLSSICDVAYAILERNGPISIIKNEN
jgi:hypothetical protein